MSLSPDIVAAQGLIRPDMRVEAGHDLYEGSSPGSFLSSIKNLGSKAMDFAGSGYDRALVVLDAVAGFVHEKAVLPTPSQSMIARIAAGALVLSAGAAGIETSVASAAGAVKPKTPKQLANAINYDYFEIFSTDTSSFKLREIVVRPHDVLKSGVCDPKNPNLPNTQRLEDSLRGEDTTFCTKVNGHYQTTHVPRKEVGITPAARAMDFTPILDAVGTDAATSAGLTADQYEAPLKVDITFDPGKHSSEADIVYGRSSSTRSTKQLSELELRVVKGVEKVTELWYK